MPLKSLLDAKTEAMLNEAIANELFASNLYRHVANHCQRLGYFGAQKFFLAEADAEMAHYQALANYINDRGSVAKVPQIPAMNESITSLYDALKAAYDTEAYLGKKYEQWYRTCECVTTQQFFLHSIEDQRKSVGEFGDLMARLERAGTNEAAILILDKELGK